MDIFTHGIIAWIIVRILKLPDWMFVLGMIPDLDSFTAIIGKKFLEKYHRGPTHSFFTALLVSSLFLLFAPALAIYAFIVYISHPIGDYLTGKEPPIAGLRIKFRRRFNLKIHGPWLLWPFKSKSYALNLIYNVGLEQFIVALVIAIIVYFLTM